MRILQEQISARHFVVAPAYPCARDISASMHVNHPTGVLLTLLAEKEKGPTPFGVGPFCFLVEAGGAHNARPCALPFGQPDRLCKMAILPFCEPPTGVSLPSPQPIKNPQISRSEGCLLVEAGGVEPPSAGTPLAALHA